MSEINIVWRHPNEAYDIAMTLKKDKTENYAEYSERLRENMVSLEDKIAAMQVQIDTLWASVFP